VHRDEELLRLAQEAGCRVMLIGIESVLEENRYGFRRKGEQASDLSDAIRRIQDHGIRVFASFMFGLDHDDESVFEKTIDFIERNRIFLSYFNTVTPYPGTPLYDQLQSEGRILSRDWSRYNGFDVVIKPRRMSVAALEGGIRWSFNELQRRIGSHGWQALSQDLGSL
jgi:radical SAM superfamily enzyme YgiQ (UPF0313 family)